MTRGTDTKEPLPSWASCHSPYRSFQEQRPSCNSSDTATARRHIIDSERAPNPDRTTPIITQYLGQSLKLAQTQTSARMWMIPSAPLSQTEGFRSIRSFSALPRNSGSTHTVLCGDLSDRANAKPQARLKMSVPLVPPNPNEFDRAARIGRRRAVFGT